MIRKLNEQDNTKLLNLIKLEPEFNLYIIGDIENFGYSQKFQELFGQFNEKNEIKAVLVRYFNIFMVYAKDNFDVHGFSKIVKNYDYGMLVGKANIISRFENTILGLEIPEVHEFAILKKINDKFEIDKNIKVKKATIDDISRIVELKNRIEEFSSGSERFKEILTNDFKAETAHGYYVEIDGKLVSYAQTSAENSMSAMVVSVMTYKCFRGKGLASACIYKLCEDKINEGKTLCLYYRNPEAGKIYHRIGFEKIGKWSMYKKKHK